MFKQHPSAVEEISMIHVPPSPRSNMLFGQQQPTSTTINANYQRYRDTSRTDIPPGSRCETPGANAGSSTSMSNSAPRRAVGIRSERNSYQRALRSVHLSAPAWGPVEGVLPFHPIKPQDQRRRTGVFALQWNSIGPNLTRCAAHPLF